MWCFFFTLNDTLTNFLSSSSFVLHKIFWSMCTCWSENLNWKLIFFVGLSAFDGWCSFLIRQTRPCGMANSAMLTERFDYEELGRPEEIDVYSPQTSQKPSVERKVHAETTARSCQVVIFRVIWPPRHGHDNPKSTQFTVPCNRRVESSSLSAEITPPIKWFFSSNIGCLFIHSTHMKLYWLIDWLIKNFLFLLVLFPTIWQSIDWLIDLMNFFSAIFSTVWHSIDWLIDLMNFIFLAARGFSSGPCRTSACTRAWPAAAVRSPRPKEIAVSIAASKSVSNRAWCWPRSGRTGCRVAATAAPSTTCTKSSIVVANARPETADWPLRAAAKRAEKCPRESRHRRRTAPWGVPVRRHRSAPPPSATTSSLAQVNQFVRIIRYHSLPQSINQSISHGY